MKNLFALMTLLALGALTLTGCVNVPDDQPTPSYERVANGPAEDRNDGDYSYQTRYSNDSRYPETSNPDDPERGGNPNAGGNYLGGGGYTPGGSDSGADVTSGYWERQESQDRTNHAFDQYINDTTTVRETETGTVYNDVSNDIANPAVESGGYTPVPTAELPTSYSSSAPETPASE